MGKPVLIKDKKEAVLDKVNSTAKGRKLLSTLEEAKDSYEEYLKQCDKVRELAIEADFTVEETNLLALIVLEKANFSTYYRRKAIQVLNPPSKIPDYSKLANRALLNDTMKALDDKTLYEGDYTLRWDFSVVSKKQLMTIIRQSADHFDMNIRNGKFNNAKAQNWEEWINPEPYEVEADLTRKELEAQIN